MLRQITALFLIVSFVAQTFCGGLVMINYYTNTAAFAKNCINKAKPKMHCNGKCQMMKKMQEEEKKEQENTERIFKIEPVVLCSGSIFCSSTVSLVNIIKPTLYDIDCSINSFPSDVFHPPQA